MKAFAAARWRKSASLAIWKGTPRLCLHQHPSNFAAQCAIPSDSHSIATHRYCGVSKRKGKDYETFVSLVRVVCRTARRASRAGSGVESGHYDEKAAERLDR